MAPYLMSLTHQFTRIRGHCDYTQWNGVGLKSLGSSYTTRRTELPQQSPSKSVQWSVPMTNLLLFPPRIAAGLAAESLNRGLTIPQNDEELRIATDLWFRRGKQIEADTIQNASAILPEPAQQLLRQIFPDAFELQTTNDPMAIDVAPLASSSSKEAEETLNQSDVLSSQIVAELGSIRSSVALVNEAAQALLAARDAAEKPLLRLNLQEARTMLEKRMEQLGNSSSSDIAAEAVSEATLLLLELETVVN